MKLNLEVILDDEGIRVVLPDSTCFDVTPNDFTLLSEVVRKAIDVELIRAALLAGRIFPNKDGDDE